MQRNIDSFFGAKAAKSKPAESRADGKDVDDAPPSKRRRRPESGAAAAAGEAGSTAAPTPEVQALLDGAASAVGFDVCDTWKGFLYGQAKKPYFRRLLDFVKQERERNEVYPPPEHVLSAFKLCERNKVRVVILGQDPYHQPNQAHGLSFSVLPGVKIPPSLRNMYKEAASDVGLVVPKHGYLLSWAKQGVFLLNTVLTVRRAEAHSHRNKGWEEFTDAVIRDLNVNSAGVVFLLWGAPAQKKKKLINLAKHHIVTAPHPSPLSAHRGFFGSKCFSKANELLRGQGSAEIDWGSVSVEGADVAE